VPPDPSTIPPTRSGGPLAALRAACFGLVSFTWTGLCFGVALLALCLAPRSGRAAHAVARLWAWGFLACFGGGIRVEHAERFAPRSPRLIVANHASWLDPPALLLAFPGQLRFVLKQELLSVPFIGWYARLAGHFLLDRANPREGKRVLEKAVGRARRHGLSPAVFPEGTRTRDGRLAPLKAGVFQLALEAGIAIQPVAILGSWDMMPRSAKAPRHAGEILLRVGEAIPVDGLAGSPGRRVLAERVERAFRDLGVD
jgi:1-acyl-sn-glycerol-3-phosphate acyltransferase